MKNLKKKSLQLFNSSWPFLLTLFIVASFFWKVFIKGLIPLPADFVVGVYHPWLDYKWGYPAGVPVKNPMTTDVVSFTYPMQTYAIDLIKKGHLPLWNPLILAGAPLLANFQSSPFSPANIIYFLTDKITAWSIQIVLQHLLAALFTYLLLRWWKVTKLSSVFGGIVFAFSGYNLIWSQWNGHALAASFFPLIILFTDKFLVTKKYLYGFLVSLVFFFFFLSGYPQSAIYLGVAVFIVWIFRIWKRKDWLKSTLLLGVFFALGIVFSSIQILPGAELLTQSQRAVEPHPFEWAFLPWNKVITFIAPDFFGNHATKNYWGPQDYTSNTGFVGVIGFLLAIISLQLFTKKKEIKILLVLLILSLLLAFPTPISIFLWRSGIFGLNAASAHRSLLLFNLAVSLLAGFGLNELSSKNIKLKWKFYALLVAGIILAGFGVYAYEINQFVGLRNLILPTLVFSGFAFTIFILPKYKVLFLLLSIVEMFYFGWKFTPFSPRHLVFPETPVIEFLMNQEKPFRTTGSKVIPINMRMPYEIETLEGYDAIYPVRIAKFLAIINSRNSGSDPLGRYGTVDDDVSKLLDLVNVKYYLTLLDKEGNLPDRFNDKRFSVAFSDKSVAVMESSTSLNRSAFFDRWVVRENDDDILNTLLDKDFDFTKEIILEEVPTQGIKGFIFTSDAWFPGWKAFVNGKETKIYRADYAFRAVPVENKNDKVEFKYQPKSFSLGLKISLVSLMVSLLLYLRLRNEKY